MVRPCMLPSNSFPTLSRASVGGIQLLVGPGIVTLRTADKGQMFGAGDIAGMTAMQVAPRIGLLIEAHQACHPRACARSGPHTRPPTHRTRPPAADASSWRHSFTHCSTGVAIAIDLPHAEAPKLRARLPAGFRRSGNPAPFLREIIYHEIFSELLWGRIERTATIDLGHLIHKTLQIVALRQHKGIDRDALEVQRLTSWSVAVIVRWLGGYCKYSRSPSQ